METVGVVDRILIVIASPIEREMLNVNLWQKIFQSRNIHKFHLCWFNWNIQLEFDEFGQRLPAMHLCHLSILQIILLRVELNLLHSARQNEQHKKNKFFEGDTRHVNALSCCRHRRRCLCYGNSFCRWILLNKFMRF